MKLFLQKFGQGLLFAALLIVPHNARSEETDDLGGFTAIKWMEGMHLTAGLGLNTSYIQNDFVTEDIGLGLNIHTDLGYYFADAYALEVSTSVHLNRVKNVLIWDTLMTGGVRFRLPAWAGPSFSAPFFRLMAGRGPSVFIFKGKKPAEFDHGGDRTQVEGDVYGLAYGFFQNSRDGKVWWLQLQSTAHLYSKLEAVKEVGSVAEVVHSEDIKDNTAMFSLSISLGVVLL